MNNELLFNIKYLSVEVVVIAIIVFGLTMLIKYPIKKVTAKLEENKRKAVNTIIVFIPMVLSFVLCLLYYGIFKGVWLTKLVFDVIGSAYLLAVGIYAVFCRIVIIIKGTNVNKNLFDNVTISEGTINNIKINIEKLSGILNINKEKVGKVVAEIDRLMKIRNEVADNLSLQNILNVKPVELTENTQITKDLNSVKNEELMQNMDADLDAETTQNAEIAQDVETKQEVEVINNLETMPTIEIKDIVSTENLDNEIEKLNEKKLKLENEIDKTQQELNVYKNADV